MAGRSGALQPARPARLRRSAWPGATKSITAHALADRARTRVAPLSARARRTSSASLGRRGVVAETAVGPASAVVSRGSASAPWGRGADAECTWSTVSHRNGRYPRRTQSSAAVDGTDTTRFARAAELHRSRLEPSDLLNNPAGKDRGRSSTTVRIGEVDTPIRQLSGSVGSS